MTSNHETPAGERLYFDDLRVGQRFVSRTQVIDQQQIIAYARQFDPQPFHVDPEAAKGSFFGGLVASGWHTAAITMRLLVESGPQIAGGMIGMGAELSWPRPTRPGDTLQVETEIIELHESKSRRDRGFGTIRCETRNQNGEVVLTLTCKVVAPRRV
jgi:acyl dehydratase